MSSSPKTLERENYFLSQLIKTGSVPKIIDHKIYKNWDQRLVMEKLDWFSIDKMQKNYWFDPDDLSILMYQSATSFEKIHNSWVWLVDVNWWSFLFTKDWCKILDFEFWVKLSDNINLDNDILSHMRRAYPEICIYYNLDEKNTLPSHAIRQWDITERASVFIEEFLESMKNSPVQEFYPNYSTQDIKKYKLDWLSDTLSTYWWNKYDSNHKNQSESWDEKELYISKRTNKSLKPLVRFIQFQAYIQDNNITLDKNLLSFLEQALSPNIEERPDSFNKIKLPWSQPSPSSTD